MRALHIKLLNQPQAYAPIWEAMRNFTERRASSSTSLPDEIWLLEHDPVFTLGQAGKPEHILNPRNIPIVHCDRGGQVTYHGPGQLMVYTLIDLKSLGLATNEFVHKLENCVIDYLQTLSLTATAKPEAPGVYIDSAKICSIGLRVKKGFSYHGLAFNVNMDLSPFSYINPCGYTGLRMTQLSHYSSVDLTQVIDGLMTTFKQNFGYNHFQFTPLTLTELLNYDQQTTSV